jgi:hypothetical protein
MVVGDAEVIAEFSNSGEALSEFGDFLGCVHRCQAEREPSQMNVH